MFRFTGESGVITALLDDGMLQVRLDSNPDIKIPAFEEDLIRDAGREPVSPGAKFIAGKKEKLPPPPPRFEVKSQYIILKSMGIQLGFEPMPGRDGQVSKFKAWLINDTPDDVLADFQLFVKEKQVLDVQEKLATMTALDAGNIMVDDLNDAPEVEFRCQRFTTAGLDEPLEKILKLKSKQFFNSMRTAPVLNVPVYHYVLVADLKKTAVADPKTAANDLLEYTRQNLRKPKQQPKNYVKYAPNVEEFAHFEPEIDLHIEKLTNGEARLDRGMALLIQIQNFEQFMEKAIRLGVPRVFIIHGIGELKLRDAIADRLRNYPSVLNFKNEFHPKYGYGATEVIFES